MQSTMLEPKEQEAMIGYFVDEKGEYQPLIEKMLVCSIPGERKNIS